MQAPSTRSSALTVLFSLVIAFVIVIVVQQAFAQDSCYRAICGGGEPYYGGDSGNNIVCNSDIGIGGARDHTVNACPDGTTMVPHSGLCRANTCPGSGAGCEEQGLCTTTEYPYYLSGSDEIASNAAACGDRPQPITLAQSHVVTPCPSGFTLVPGVGVCRRCPTTNPRFPIHVSPVGPPIFLRLPDLIIRTTWLSTPTSPAHLNAAHRGTPYLLCFTVANVGSGASGAFRVGGGGLGVPVAPFQDHAALAAGASRTGCLTYATTPPPGAYNVTVTADSLHAVSESNEGNNDALAHIIVTP